MGIKSVSDIKLKNRNTPAIKTVKKVRSYMFLKNKQKIDSPNDYIKHKRKMDRSTSRKNKANIKRIF